MVEFAIVLPILILLALGAVDFGAVMGQSSSLESAVRAGAEVGKVIPTVTSSTLTGLGLFPSSVTPTVNTVCTCADGTWPTGATCPPSPLATPCSGKRNPFISGTPLDPRVIQYVQVSANQSYSPIVTYGGLGPPTSMTSQAFTRTQ
jgi:hypothetical protein